MVVDHGLVVVLHTIPQTALGANINGVEEFGGEIAVGGNAGFEDYLLVADGENGPLCAHHKSTVWAKEDLGNAGIKCKGFQ